MKMNLDDKRKEITDVKENLYPLDAYIKKAPSIELSIDFSTLGKSPFSEEDLSKLREIKELVMSAEDEINTMALKSARKNGEVFHIEQPSYFDDNFDREKYVRDLVNAKFQGMRIIEHENANTKVQKIIMLKKAIDKINNEDSSSSETITVHTAPSVRQVKLENNATANKYPDTKQQSSDEIESRVNKEVVNSNVINVKSQEIVEIDQNNSEGGYSKMSRSNHKIIEIKSLEAEPSNIHEKQLVVSRIPGLSVEIMPSINIRSQLIEQKIPSVDIFPTDKNNLQPSKANNVAIISTEYQDSRDAGRDMKAIEPVKKIKQNVQVTTITNEESVKELKDDVKVSRGSNKGQQKNVTHLHSENTVDHTDIKNKAYLFLNKNETDRIHLGRSNTSKLKKYGLPEMQQIYNPKTQVYKRCPEFLTRAATSTNKYLTNISKQPVFLRKANTSSYITSKSMPNSSHLNTSIKSEYIPYTKLTIGGYKPDEVETIFKKKHVQSEIDFETNTDVEPNPDEVFDDSDNSEVNSENISLKKSGSSEDVDNNSMEQYLDDFDIDCKSDEPEEKIDDQNTIESKSNKISSLGLKSKVDVFDFVDYVKTKDDSTQSSPVKDVSFRETQTSPEQAYVQNNENINRPKNIDVNNITLADMLQIQKILASLNLQFANQSEDGDDKNVEGQTSRSDKLLNVPQNLSNLSTQRDTQTSPCKTKNVMTSPAKMVGQMLSPIFKDSKIDAETSPWDVESQIDENNSASRKIVLDIDPIPGTSHGNTYTLSPKKLHLKESTDAFTDVSQSESSETHSLGEINLRILRRRSLIIKKQHMSDSTSTSLGLNSSSDVQLDSSNHNLPKKSDGEISEGQVLKP